MKLYHFFFLSKKLLTSLFFAFLFWGSGTLFASNLQTQSASQKTSSPQPMVFNAEEIPPIKESSLEEEDPFDLLISAPAKEKPCPIKKYKTSLYEKVKTMGMATAKLSWVQVCQYASSKRFPSPKIGLFLIKQSPTISSFPELHVAWRRVSIDLRIALVCTFMPSSKKERYYSHKDLEALLKARRAQKNIPPPQSSKINSFNLNDYMHLVTDEDIKRTTEIMKANRAKERYKLFPHIFYHLALMHKEIWHPEILKKIWFELPFDQQVKLLAACYHQMEEIPATVAQKEIMKLLNSRLLQTSKK